MSNLQLIEELCRLVEQETVLVRTLATKLEEIRCLSEIDHAAIKAVEDKYTEILGAEELPDDL